MNGKSESVDTKSCGVENIGIGLPHHSLNNRIDHRSSRCIIVIIVEKDILLLDSLSHSHNILYLIFNLESSISRSLALSLSSSLIPGFYSTIVWI